MRVLEGVNSAKKTFSTNVNFEDIRTFGKHPQSSPQFRETVPNHPAPSSTLVWKGMVEKETCRVECKACLMPCRVRHALHSQETCLVECS